QHTTDSCAIFGPGAGIRLLQAVTEIGPVDIELTTQFADGWGSVEHQVVAVTSGAAPAGANVNEALRLLLEELLAIVSVSANAWVGSFGKRCDEANESKDSAVCSRPKGISAFEVREVNEMATGALLDQISAHPS